MPNNDLEIFEIFSYLTKFHILLFIDDICVFTNRKIVSQNSFKGLSEIIFKYITIIVYHYNYLSPKIFNNSRR